MWLRGLKTFLDPNRLLAKTRRGADVVRFSGRSANNTIESGPFRSRSKVRRQKRQNARLEPRRRQNATGFDSQGLRVRLTGPGAHRRDVLQLRPCERSTETQSR